MNKITILSAMLIAGIVSASAATTSADIITKLAGGKKPVKENGVYVVPSADEKKSGEDKGLKAPERIRKAAFAGENVRFALDSLVGRMENGDYTVKEAYRYDDNGNSIEANYYNWDYDAEDWGLNQKITAEYDSDNRKTSEETLFFSPWGNSGNRNIMTYDENGANIQTDIYMLEEGVWKPSQKSFFKYDTYGQMTEEVIQVPGETEGDWVNLQKNVAEWTPSGLRTLAESYSWDGSEWIPADGRLIYEFDDAGRMTLFLNDVWVDGEWQHFLRVIQEWGEYGLTYQTYELWNENREDWFGSPAMASSYAVLAYDDKGRNISEIGYNYDLDIMEWVEANRIESEYTELENGLTRQFKTAFNIEHAMVVDEVTREYNQAGCDTYFKERARESFSSPLVPLEEKFMTYAENGTTLLSEEDYVFGGETRYAYVKQWHEYDEAGYPVESWYQHGRYYETGEGEPEEWNNYSHFTYKYENGEELSRMCYFWQDGEYVSGWGEEKDFNFNVPISDCLYWMNAELDADYQITASRIYRPEGTGWTYEEGVWHYSELNNVGVGAIEDKTDMRIFPNPTADFVNIDCENGAGINIYSIQGALMIFTTEHTVDVSGLAKGVYIVNVDGKSARLIKK